MSPANPMVASQLRQLIYYNLDNELVQNAQFLAGRLFAYEPRSHEAAYLLALSHLRLGQFKAAFDRSRSSGSRGSHLGCAYVFALACLSLGSDYYKQGIAALDRSRGLWGGRNNWNKHSETARRHLPDAAAVYCLLGKLYHAHNDIKKAVDCYAEALKLNPFMWDALLGLCKTGANVRIPNIYKMTPDLMALLSSSSILEEDHIEGSDEAFNSISGPLQSQPNINPNPTASDPFRSVSNRMNGDNLAGVPGGGLFQKFNESSIPPTGPPLLNTAAETPVSSNIALPDADEGIERMQVTAGEVPHAPARKTRMAQAFNDAPPRMRSTSTRPKVGSRLESDESGETQMSRISMAQGDRKRTVSGQVAQGSTSVIQDPSAAPQRRSVRLFNQIRPTTTKFSATSSSIGFRDGRELKKARVPGTKVRSGATTSTVGRVVSGNRKPIETIDVDTKEIRAPPTNTGISTSQHRSQIIDSAKELDALQQLLDLFMKLGNGYYALSHYHCQEALQIFSSLPLAQRDTPWVLAQIGRAHFEQASYAEAEKYFVRVTSLAPSIMDDMEVYSTILWHLKNEVTLAYLAHELVEIDRLSPQAWCAVGNSFSLQREHDQALKCFKRATQLDPKFAYAFTLQGHEHVSNEEYDKALAAYRNGIAADNRHYNSWYGLGKVYEKMGKYDIAERHFRTAAAINPTNSVLVCCVGMVLEKLKNPRAALVQYNKACDMAPRSALCRFKKARVLMTLQEPQLALVELKVLKDIAPDEANVHFLLGRLYKMLHQKANSIKHFTTALNLDPKAAQYIKEAMESLEDDEEDDDDEQMS